MAAEKIGDGTCPLCQGVARVSLSKSGLTVMTCNGCNMQLFTRSGRSDELVRARIKLSDGPAPAAEPIQLPGPAAVVLPVHAAAPIPPKPARIGIFKSW